MLTDLNTHTLMLDECTMFCFRTAFVFLALMEFTVVNYLWRLGGQQACRNKTQQKTNGGNGSGGLASVSRHPSSDPITRRIPHSEGTGECGSEENSKAGSPISNTLVQVTRNQKRSRKCNYIYFYVFMQLIYLKEFTNISIQYSSITAI